MITKVFLFFVAANNIQLHSLASQSLQLHKNGLEPYPASKQQGEYYSLPHTLWSNGDLRLVSMNHFIDDNFDILSGRLEVYINTELAAGSDGSSGDGVLGSWGSVCGVGFSLVEASVACQQLGYAVALDWELSSETVFGKGNGSVPIFLHGLQCSQSGLSHLMRCWPQTEFSGSCTHDDDVAIYCDSTDEGVSSYRGEVRLVSEFNNSSVSVSSGRVEVYQGRVWGTVCNKEFNQAAADTVCRQLGYTNALDIYDAEPGEGLVWVGEITCSSSSPCFKDCFQAHQWSHDCNHTTDVAVQCTYDESLAPENTSGNEKLCSIGLFPLSTLILTVSLALTALLLLGILFAITLCTACLIYRRRKRIFKLYEPLS